MAALLMLALSLKPALYYLLMTRFYLRARPSFTAAMVLNNYSEFGLIVMAIATQANIIPKEWSVIIALVLSLSYILSSLMITRNDQIYGRLKTFVKTPIKPLQSYNLPDMNAFHRRCFVSFPPCWGSAHCCWGASAGLACGGKFASPSCLLFC